MTTLFNCLQPAQKLRISVSDIAQLLKIPQHLIVRVECWAYVVFVHRRDVGGQFISYRKLEQWKNAVACQIQKCSAIPQLQKLWLDIIKDCRKYKKQYETGSRQFFRKIRLQRWEFLRQKLRQNPELIAPYPESEEIW
ncbi:MAG: hypothetical protein F6J89_26260 [Symploca sp. SIO1C4]|uniref:Uncharacterized protein n=1 Tax=Symploca sp. SIO1C4 TaxID=2607765 RepID=A0A6B3NBU6_9CYAN|nr:hypothetical protein [Symploca sp. SIO1C4]NET05723.1 hypothetical protein [Symploca sp. SIO2B6]